MRQVVAAFAVFTLSLGGCLKHEVMTQEEVLKANPRPDQFVKSDTSIRQPLPATCLAAGKMYEAMYKTAHDPMQRRDFAWRAKQAYQQAERLQARSPEAAAGMARVFELEGDFHAAHHHYQLCLGYLTGKSGEAIMLHDVAMYYARCKEYDSSLSLMNRAMQLEPGNRTFAMNYGYILGRAGRYDESHRHFLQISTPGDAAYQVALMAKHLGNVEACRQYAQVAIQTDPQKSASAQALLASLDQPATSVQQAQFEQPVPGSN